MIGERCSDLFNHRNNSLCIIFLVEIHDHFFHSFIPKIFPCFCVNTFVTKHCHLSVFKCNVHECCIAVSSLFHFQAVKNFCSTINCIHKAATFLNVHTHFATRCFFGILYCR